MDIVDGSGRRTKQRGRPVGLRNTKMSITSPLSPNPQKIKSIHTYKSATTYLIFTDMRKLGSTPDQLYTFFCLTQTRADQLKQHQTNDNVSSATLYIIR